MNKATGRAYGVCLKRVGIIDTSYVMPQYCHRLLSSPVTTSVLRDLIRGIVGSQSEIAMTAINTIVRVVPSERDVLATRRSFFKVHNDVRGLGGGLELAQGWYQYVLRQLKYTSAFTLMSSSIGAFVQPLERWSSTSTRPTLSCMVCLNSSIDLGLRMVFR